MISENGISLMIPAEKTVRVIDKINPQPNNALMGKWEFASFSTNTLTGAYSKVSSSKQNCDISKSSGSSKSLQKSNENHIQDIANTSNEAQYSPIIEDIANKSTFQRIPSPEMFFNIKRFLFIFNENKDKGRFKELCTFLLENSETELNTKVSIYCNLLYNKCRIVFDKKDLTRYFKLENFC